MSTHRTIVAILLACLTLQAQQKELALSTERYQAGRYQESIDAAKAALKADPKSAAAYNNIAVAYLALKKYDEAIANAQQALRLQPGYTLASNNLAWIRQEQAKAQGKASPPPTNTQPTAESYLEQSIQAYQLARFPECVALAKEALRLRPDYAYAYNNIGACSASLGKWDDAIRNDQQALRLMPDLQLAKNNLAWALQQKAAATKH
jgi:tetratricopeptide (TPR) repeat protein